MAVQKTLGFANRRPAGPRRGKSAPLRVLLPGGGPCGVFTGGVVRFRSPVAGRCGFSRSRLGLLAFLALVLMRCPRSCGFRRNDLGIVLFRGFLFVPVDFFRAVWYGALDGR